MNANEAADIIDAMAASLRNQPQQFNISIKVTGQSIVSHGGTGMSISVSGGGPGSTTTGNKVSISDAQVELAQQQGTQAMEEQVEALLASLAGLSKEFRSSKPNTTLIKQAIHSLRDTWVPGVIIGVLGNIASKTFGV